MHLENALAFNTIISQEPMSAVSRLDFETEFLKLPCNLKNSFFVAICYSYQNSTLSGKLLLGSLLGHKECKSA